MLEFSNGWASTDVHSVMWRDTKKTSRTSLHSDVYQLRSECSHAELESQRPLVVGLRDSSQLSSDNTTPSFVAHTTVRLRLDSQLHWNIHRTAICINTVSEIYHIANHKKRQWQQKRNWEGGLELGHPLACSIRKTADSHD